MTPDESFGQWSTSVDDINKSPEGCISCEFDELPQVGVYVSLDSMTCRDNKLMSCPGLNIGGPLTQSITKGSCICLSNAKDATPPIARVFKINPEYHIGEGHIEFLLESGEGRKQQFSWIPHPSFLSITFPDSKKRLTYHLANYHPTFYAVHRTDFLKMGNAKIST